MKATPTMGILAVMGLTLLGGCTAELSKDDRALLESAKVSATQAQQSAAAAAQSASEAQQSAAAAAQSAAAAQNSAQQVEQIFKKMQRK
jgi:uncharacterized lipoprotein NlpE involved in copper resistance